MVGARSSTAAIRALAMHHVRRAWPASVALAVFAGLVAAVPMSLLSASRYGDRAMERFLALSDPPELLVSVCPPGVDPVAEGIDACFQSVDLAREERRLAGLDHVRSTSVGGMAFAQGGGSPDPATWGPPLPGYVNTGPAESATGRPLLLEGRFAERHAPDEIVLTEHAAERHGIGVGDRFHLRGPASDRVVSSTVVGVARTVDDFLPGNNATSPAFLVREGWLEAQGDAVAAFVAVLVHTEDGRADDVGSAIPAAFTDQVVNVEDFIPVDQHRIAGQALDFEAGALLAVAAGAALAAVAVIAQVVARRGRSELDQASTLRAMGATNGFLAASTVLRWVPVAAGAVAVALAALAVSPALGPFGVARRAPWSGDPRLDVPVAAGGSGLLLLALLVPAAVTVGRRTAPAVGGPAAIGRGVVVRAASTFLRQSLGRRSVGSMATAVVVSAVAVAALMGTVTITDSLDRVITEPDRFGAPFDALLPGAMGFDLDVDGLEAAINFAGTDAEIGGENVWVQAVLPIDGVAPVAPVIFEGRAPVAPDEVVLGPLTMRDIGGSIGDTIEIPDEAGALAEFEIVGVGPITDGYEHNVGIGGLFTPEGLDRIDALALDNSGDIGVVVDPDRRDEALGALVDANPAAFVPFPVPSTLSNANRIAALPVFLAVGGAAVSAATFVHALLLATRQRRRDLAVLRVLGLLRRQTFVVVTAMAGAVAVLVAVVGGVLGLVAGGWGWQLVSDAFGVDPSVSYPGVVLVAAPTAAVAVGLIAAMWPARRASNVRPARALRTD